MTDPLEVRRITETDELFAIAPAWNELAGGVFFRRAEWLQTWWGHYRRPERQLYAVGVWRGEQLVGVAPWMLESAAGGRTIRWLGSGDVCSDYLTVLCRPADETSVVDALSDWLFVASTSADDRWTLLDLESVWQDDSAIARLKDKLDDRGCSVSERSTMSCWRITLPSTWEEYMSRLSKSHRKQVRRIERRTLPRHETQLRRVSNLKELEPAMEILIRLHQKRWLALGEPGCFGRESFEPFLREAAQRFCEMGDLDLVWLEESGRPVAAQIAFLSESTCFVFQSGIDPDFQDYSPGHVIHVLTMQRAIESGRRYFDFLRGDEPYKLHWRADPLSCVNLRIAPPLAVAQIRNGMWLAQDVVRRAVKDGLRWSGLR